MATTLPNTGAVIPATGEKPDQAVNNAAFTKIDTKIGDQSSQLTNITNKLLSGSVLPNNTDLDTLYGEGATGIYQLLSSNTYQNAPGAAGLLIVEATSAAAVQRFVGTSINQLRYRTSSAWGTWRDQ